MTTITHTDRDLFADMLPQSGWIYGNAMVRQNLSDRAAEGIEALCALWFDQYEDEKNLPPELVRLIEMFCTGNEGFYVESDRLEAVLDPEFAEDFLT